MKLKYYLKGLGIGMIISAALMGALFYFYSDSGTMTDAQVIERARQLGMVEDLSFDADGGLFESVDVPGEEAGEEVVEAGEEVPEEVDEGVTDAGAEDGEEAAGAWSNDPASEETDTE